MKYKSIKLFNPTSILITASCLFWSTVTVATDIDTFKSRIVVDMVDKEDRTATSEGTTLTAKADGFLQTQLSNGCWTDIDYTDIDGTGGWSPTDHLKRLYAMAAERYASGDSGMSNGVLKALDCWYTENPTATNWWWNEIGKQHKLGPVGLLMQSDLSATQLNNIITDMPLTPYKTGANRADISKAIVYGGLLSNDTSRVSVGIDGILDTIVITEDEGLQADMSWLQHGPQLHNGSYGGVWLGTALVWAYYVRDLQWAFPSAQADLIASYVLDGNQWMTRPNGGMDYSTAGRSISRAPNASLPASTIDPLPSEKISAITPSRSSEAIAYQDFLDTGVSTKTGFKHFWRADYSVSKRQDYTFTIRMSSDDVSLQEHGNGENERGYWMGFGNTFLYQTGKEYEDIFPVWRWDFMSGVTAPRASLVRKNAWGNNYQNSSFVGAVTDGQYGVTVMDFVHTESTTGVNDTFAKKSWFSFEDEIVALGAGITSTRSEYISTTINETLLNGPVTVDGVVYPEGSTDLSGSKWVHHDNVGYVFPTSWYGKLENETQTGNWADLNTSNDDEEVSKKTFFLRIGHSWQPVNRAYQYIIVPGVTTTETQTYSDNSPVTVLENTNNIQAVRHSALNITGIVFHTAGTLEIYPGLTVTVDKPSAVLLDESDANPIVTLSTPGSSDIVNVTLTSSTSGIVTQSMTTPSSEADEGNSISAIFDFSSETILTFSPVDDARVRGGTYTDTNYGNSGYLVVKDSPNSSYDRNSYLKWNLSTVPVSSVDSAELRLYVKGVTGSPASFLISESNDNWQENSITMTNSPAVGTLITTATASSVGEWITIDLTNYVNNELAGDKTISTVLTPNAIDDYIGLGSSEAGAGMMPELVITYLHK